MSAAQQKRNKDLAVQLARAHDEITRLRRVILQESVRWQNHHTDPSKRAYWEMFSLQAWPETAH